MEEVTLLIREQVFKVRKDTLCEHSDYFRAMFSGHYVENNKEKVCIDVLEPEIVKIIIQYMQIGLINLYEFDLSTIRDITVVANFLQITELMRQIEYTLELQICESNWIEIMEIAENSSFSKLERTAAVFGLFAFKSMKPDYIPSMSKLVWYLSNCYLDVENELNVFKFGYKWIINNETGADALLLVLSCLDLGSLTSDDINNILQMLKDYVDSLAVKVVQCLYILNTECEGISAIKLQKNKQMLIERFTLRVWMETNNIVSESKNRKLIYTAILPMWQSRESNGKALPQCLYTYNDNDGLKQWMEVSHSLLWGWNIITWGLTKIVMVCGEYDRGSGKFMRDVKVYDTMENTWSTHGVELPQRRHAGLAVIGNSLYIVGGVGGHRIVLNTAIIYDLKERTHRKIAKIADAIQSPAVCSHNNKVYAALQNNVYRHEDKGNTDIWIPVVATEIRLSCIRSYKDYIYGIQGYFSHLYRFRPDVDERMEIVTQFSNLPTTICNLGNRLLVFTRIRVHSDQIFVEEFKGESSIKTDRINKDDSSLEEARSCKTTLEENTEDKPESSFVNRSRKIHKGECLGEKPKIIYEQALNSSEVDTVLRVNDVAGSGVAVLSMPPLIKDISDYQKRHLSQYR